MNFQEAHETPVPQSNAVLERLTELPPHVAAWGRPWAARDADHAYIKKHGAKLKKAYPDEWIAVLDGAVVAHSPESSALVRQLRKLKLLDKSPVTYHLRTPDFDL